MCAVCTPRLSQRSPVELFIERIAQLVEAESIAVLDVHPASPLQPPFRLLAPLGRLSCERLNRTWFERLQPGQIVIAPPEVAWREAASRTTLKIPMRCSTSILSGSVVWPSSIPRQNSAELAGAVLMLVARDRAGSGATRTAMEMLVSWGVHEIARNRELANSRRLSQRHVQQREQERLSLATEIHDDLSQSLTFIQLTLASLQRQVKRSNFDRVESELAELAVVSKQTAESVQKLSTSLRPAMIEAVGPVSAIRQEARRFEETAGIAVDCRLEQLDLSPAVSLAAFRILEHGLDNIACHANASRVIIRLAHDGDVDVLEVRDNGRGFDVSRFANSIGLLSLAERAEMAGGHLSIDSSPGRGTRLVASFPVSALMRKDDRER